MDEELGEASGQSETPKEKRQVPIRRLRLATSWLFLCLIYTVPDGVYAPASYSDSSKQETGADLWDSTTFGAKLTDTITESSTTATTTIAPSPTTSLTISLTTTKLAPANGSQTVKSDSILDNIARDSDAAISASEILADDQLFGQTEGSNPRHQLISDSRGEDCISQMPPVEPNQLPTIETNCNQRQENDPAARYLLQGLILGLLVLVSVSLVLVYSIKFLICRKRKRRTSNWLVSRQNLVADSSNQAERMAHELLLSGCSCFSISQQLSHVSPRPPIGRQMAPNLWDLYAASVYAENQQMPLTCLYQQLAVRDRLRGQLENRSLSSVRAPDELTFAGSRSPPPTYSELFGQSESASRSLVPMSLSDDCRSSGFLEESDNSQTYSYPSQQQQQQPDTRAWLETQSSRAQTREV